MNIGWVGLGKLGYPCALVMAKHGGHTVTGYDLNPPTVPDYEVGIDELDPSGVTLADSIEQVVAAADVVFVAVQTPHAPAYGGEQPAPDERRDFEYSFLVTAARAVCAAAHAQQKPITLAVVSTVLPGTCGRLIRPLLNPYVTLVYNPAFIAMGTTIADFRAPEFVLLGADDSQDTELVQQAYAALHDRPCFITGVETAELVKVAYNTAISTKIVLANTLMEICHKTGADVDAVTDALAMATDRVASAAYLRGGMGDGGQCHPRDLIALSWLAQRLGLSYDLLGDMAAAREVQTGWLAQLTRDWAEQTGHGICILGTAYKPGVPLEHGSPALLLRNLLEQQEPVSDYLSRSFGYVATYDPVVDPDEIRLKSLLTRPHVYVIGCKHPEFVGYDFPAGSVVIDPHGYIPDQDGVTVDRVGRKQ